jgi:hypothetical protein
MESIVPQHFFDAAEFARPLRLNVLVGTGLLLLVCLLPGSEFFPMIHNATSSGLLEEESEGLAGAVEFSANGVRRLFG